MCSSSGSSSIRLDSSRLVHQQHRHAFDSCRLDAVVIAPCMHQAQRSCMQPCQSRYTAYSHCMCGICPAVMPVMHAADMQLSTGQPPQVTLHGCSVDLQLAHADGAWNRGVQVEAQGDALAFLDIDQRHQLHAPWGGSRVGVTPAGQAGRERGIKNRGENSKRRARRPGGAGGGRECSTV